MTFRPKLWVGVGAFAVAGATIPSVAASAGQAALLDQPASKSVPAEGGRAEPERVAQEGLGGEGGERGGQAQTRPATRRHQKPKVHHTPSARPTPGGEGGEGGERGADRPYVFDGAGTRYGQTRGEYHVAGSGGEGGERGKAGVNTRYIFGFTDGADVEPQGEIEIESDNVLRFGKRTGDYRALESKTEFEYGATDNLLLELSGITSYNRIHGVPDLDNRDAARFDGVSIEPKYLILDRRTHPFGLAVSIEPEYTRFDGTSGRREDGYSLETKLLIERELISNAFFAAVNLTYEPELVHVNEFDVGSGRFVNFARESALGLSGAITYAVAPGALLGGELRYLTQFSGGLGLNRFAGDALFVGPTLSIRFLSVAPNVLLQAAYSVQVAGSNVDDPAANLNLNDFERQQVRLRLVYEF